jgi:hypothetical protein
MYVEHGLNAQVLLPSLSAELHPQSSFRPPLLLLLILDHSQFPMLRVVRCVFRPTFTRSSLEER